MRKILFGITKVRSWVLSNLRNFAGTNQGFCVLNSIAGRPIKVKAVNFELWKSVSALYSYQRYRLPLWMLHGWVNAD